MPEPGRSLTRKEFEEVIRRAAELAASEPEAGEGQLTESELFRIAREVGLEERYVRRALAEVRAFPGTRTPLDVLFGPSTVVASRVVPRARGELVDVLDEFLVAGHLLQAVRRAPSLLQYRPAVDWASRIARAASATSRRHYVASARRVEIRMEEGGEGSTLVEIEVEPGIREEYLTSGLFGGGAAGLGGGIGVGMAVASAAPAALAVAVGVGTGVALLGGVAWLSGRFYRRRLLDVRSEVEGILDRLEAGESLEPPPPSWRRWVRRHFHGVARELRLEEGDDER